MRLNWIAPKSKLKAIKNQGLDRPPILQELSKAFLRASSKALRQEDTDLVDPSLKKSPKAVGSGKRRNLNREAARSKEEEEQEVG